MDLRVWLLRNALPAAVSLRDAVLHIPCTEYRSYSVLKVFAAGYRTGFKLTDSEGQPTEALRLMVSTMQGVTMCRGPELPDNVKRAFGKDESTLANLVDDTWWLQGLTPRIRSAFSVRQYGGRDWVWEFMPGLDGGKVSYKEDGKVRRRLCFIARCQPDWRLNDAVYEGLWRWNYDHIDTSTIWRRPAPCPDAYGILECYPSIRFASGQGDGECPPEGGGATPAARLQATIGGA